MLSLAVGTALAWCLNRLRFPGRDLVVGLFASAIVTPGMVVAFGLLSIWGRNGWINQASEALFGFSIGNPAFGLSGILFAHVILDGAFAARILLARLDAIPESRLKTGQSLALSAWQRFAIIDWPAMRGTLPGLARHHFPPGLHQLPHRAAARRRPGQPDAGSGHLRRRPPGFRPARRRACWR